MDEHELERLDAWARERGWTKSHAVRVAIRAVTRIREQDSLLRACGMIDGLPADLSERVDDYLKETYVAEKAASRYGKRRRQR
jgi:hypothetical protein